MIEKVYNFKKTGQKLIEKIVNDQYVNINHMVIPMKEGLPVHSSNSNIYLIVIKGRMDIRLGEQEPASYEAGSIINVPYGIRMDIQNKQRSLLEFFVIKAPHPKQIKTK